MKNKIDKKMELLTSKLNIMKSLLSFMLVVYMSFLYFTGTTQLHDLEFVVWMLLVMRISGD
jgi:hypothetical protein